MFNRSFQAQLSGEYAFGSLALADKVNEALRQPEIGDSFAQAIFVKDYHFKSKYNLDYKVYTSSTCTCKLNTAEGWPAFLISWRTDASAREEYTLRGHKFSIPYETFLFLSAAEIIFIPAPSLDCSADSYHQYEGMLELYGVSSLRQKLSLGMIRKIADNTEVVKSLGLFRNPAKMKELGQEIDVEYSSHPDYPESFSLSDKKYNLTTCHAFKKQSFWFFAPVVDYKKTTSLADMLVSCFGEETESHCLKRS